LDGEAADTKPASDKGPGGMSTENARNVATNGAFQERETTREPTHADL
jgi:hypothetical protein